MKDPKYPVTPMRNCLYCVWFNAKAVSCDHPRAQFIATFSPNQDKDCVLLSYDKSETPDVPDNAFAQKFCIGKKCPYYFAKSKLCTRPSLCPYKGEEATVFTNIKLKAPKEP
jgi:hypothetical protein